MEYLKGKCPNRLRNGEWDQHLRCIAEYNCHCLLIPSSAPCYSQIFTGSTTCASEALGSHKFATSSGKIVFSSDWMVGCRACLHLLACLSVPHHFGDHHHKHLIHALVFTTLIFPSFFSQDRLFSHLAVAFLLSCQSFALPLIHHRYQHQQC